MKQGPDVLRLSWLRAAAEVKVFFAGGEEAQDVGVGELAAFGLTGGTRGVDDVGAVLRVDGDVGCCAALGGDGGGVAVEADELAGGED